MALPASRIYLEWYAILEHGTSLAKIPRAVSSPTKVFITSAGPDMVEESELLWQATSISGGQSAFT